MRETLRELAWRLGRKLYTWGRRDLANDPTRNGEHWLIERVLERSQDGSVLFDVGANVGNWTRHALHASDRNKRAILVHAFEPCSSTRDILKGRLPQDGSVEIHGVALSATEGEADFFFNQAGGGTNSLSSVSGSTRERVQLSTVDRFCEQHRIDHVALLKIDTEGFDFSVLQGAAGTLAAGSVEIVQFEYNWRWLLNKASLLEVFNFISDKPYRFGKLAGESIVFFDAWHFELDRYFENNYVLVRIGSPLESLGRHQRFDASNVATLAGGPS